MRCCAIAAFVGCALLLGGCAHVGDEAELQGVDGGYAAAHRLRAWPGQSAHASAQRAWFGAWGETTVTPAAAGADGPYLLDSGDRLRIAVYGEPDLSRRHVVDHDGNIAVPLIGTVRARGRTTGGLTAVIRSRLSAKYIKDPQVTVDIYQNRPFYIHGAVRSPGQYPYVRGMTVDAAVAIAGGYGERADERRMKITRPANGGAEAFDASAETAVRPGDTIRVRERFLF